MEAVAVGGVGTSSNDELYPPPLGESRSQKKLVLALRPVYGSQKPEFTPKKHKTLFFFRSTCSERGVMELWKSFEGSSHKVFIMSGGGLEEVLDVLEVFPPVSPHQQIFYNSPPPSQEPSESCSGPPESLVSWCLVQRSSFEGGEEEKRNPKITTNTVLNHLNTTYF